MPTLNQQFEAAVVYAHQHLKIDKHSSVYLTASATFSGDATVIRYRMNTFSSPEVSATGSTVEDVLDKFIAMYMTQFGSPNEVVVPLALPAPSPVDYATFEE